MASPTRNAKKDDKKQSNTLPTSPGRRSRSVTPKDVSGKDATSKDITERNLASSNMDEREQELLDEAGDETFPASDASALIWPQKKPGTTKSGKTT